jgi:hypothetical protein
VRDLRSKAFNRVRSDEVPFNYQLGALLGYSLTVGSELVELLHPKIELMHDTELVALQNFSKLDDDLGDSSFEIDFAFQDSETVLGIESKRKSILTSSQLEKESQVLGKNSGGRNVVLLAVTEDTEPPPAVANADTTMDHPILWTSWHRIALAFERCNLTVEHNPIRHMVIDLLDDTDYTLSFDGFPEPALDSTIYIEWMQQFTNLLYDLETVLQDEPLCLNRTTGQNMPSYASKRTNELEKSYRQPAAPAFFVPFTLDSNNSLNNYGQDTHVSLYGNYHDNEFGVFLDLNPRSDGWSNTVLKENRGEIVDSILTHNMLLRVSRNSHSHSKRSPEDFHTRDGILECIENTVGTKDGKRVLMGRFLSEGDSPEKTVDAFAAELRFIHSEFFQDGRILGQYRPD